MKTKHTPGPWQTIRAVDICNSTGRLVAETNDKVVNSKGGLSIMDRDEQRSNAKLIAAAPELLDALWFCRSVIEKQGMFDLSERMAFEKASNAIKKATE